MSEPHYLQAELYQRVAEDRQLFDFFESASLDGVWYWDLENPEHEWMSARFWQVLGYDPSERQHLAAEWQDLIHPDDLPLALENFQRHRADPNHPYDQIVRYRRPDGRWTVVRCRGLIIRDDHGKPIRMLGCHTDVTALHQAQNELSDANERLEAAVAERTRELQQQNRQLERFASVIAHDIKAPLRGIVLASGWLADELGEDITASVKESIDFVTSRAHRAAALIDGVLAYTRAAQMKPKLTEVATDELLEHVVGGLDLRDGVEVSYEGTFPVLVADRSQLHQVFQNLIENAAYHSAPMPCSIIVRGKTKQGVAEFAVVDDGPGIDPKHHEQVFELLSTLQSRDVRDTTGVGLAICRWLVESWKGQIGVESEVGKGATFSFTVPLRRKGPR